MTPLEELQAAHKRLSAMKQEATGTWLSRPGESLRWYAIHDSEEVVIADVDQREHAGLIVTLHRTIDAQLAILQDAISYTENNDDQEYLPLELALARAINGEEA